MSTYYTGILIRKAPDKPIEVVCDDIDCNFIKNCMCGWDIEGDECYPENEDFSREVKERTKFMHTKYLLSIKKSDFADDAFDSYKKETPSGDSVEIVFHYDNGNEMNLLKKIIEDKMQVDISTNEELKKLVDMSDNEKKAYFDQFYNICLEYPVYRRGAFYSAHSFDEAEKRAEAQLSEIAENKKKWNDLKNSLDYLKLSEEEKENVESSFEGRTEDYDNDWHYMKESASKVRHLCEAFSGWRDEDVYLYIYSDNAEYNELPDWIFEGMSLSSLLA